MNPFEEDEEPEKPIPSIQVQLTATESLTVSPFHGLISRCFEGHLNIFVDSQDKNMAELIDRFVADLKIQGSSLAQAEIEGCCVLPSCADLFVFYKKCLLQCAQLSTGQPMLSLTSVFKKYLRESNNASSITPVLPMSMSSLTKDFTRELRDLSSGGAAGLIQNFQSLLKEGDMSNTSHKYNKDDIARICTILTTAEYCLETTQQLEGKLKEKVQPALADKVDLGPEQDLFGSHNQGVSTLNVPRKKHNGSLYTGFGVVAISVVSWFVYQGYLETRVNSPLTESKVAFPSSHDFPERYWGSFRPGVYFGMKSRDTHSLLAGLMWFMPDIAVAGNLNLRHLCDQGDNLEQYGWKEHDGKNFGVQVIIDKFIQLETSFITKLGGNHGGDWTARIHVEPRMKELVGQEVTLFFYLTLDDNGNGLLQPIKMIDNMDTSGMDANESVKFLGLSAVHGHTEKLGDFRVSFHHANQQSIVHTAFLSTTIGSPQHVKDALQSGLRLMEDKRSKERHISLARVLFPKEDKLKQPNFVVHQVTGKLPLQLEIVYESNSFVERGAMLRGEVYDVLLQKYRKEFRVQFESKFRLNEKGFSEEEQDFAKSAMSNLVGGIGYFYGSSKVQSVYNKEPVPYWNAPLYTAVPSRSFFPRGFLWDEGFHNLIISQWDREISFDIMAHWFDLMNIEGWIPREQILGSEARARVPEEFVVQKNNQGNPPTFFLVLDAMFKKRPVRDISTLELEQLNRMWPRLVGWYNWFNTSLHGPEPGTYYWRGRDTASIRELNPKSLSSGLDDYPRASHPTTSERHLDLRCWITLAAKVMASIADIVGRDGRKYHETFVFLSNNELLNAQHWSEKAKRYVDFGLHSTNVTLRRPKNIPGQPKPEKIRWVSEEPTLRFVDDTFGYVSLFPLMIEILQPNSPQLGQLLQDLRNPNLLWTKYGLRSLSKTSPLYNKRNTEHDPPYWRGPIWINMNYLVARALHHYSVVEGPHQTRALLLYNELRENLISNILREYRKTGYIWEQYNDANGAGQGCRPFTGWSTLVLLLMSETYV
uniref:Mannosyl-oligosaccharide glucosidase n=1 Tax=Daphnia hispanica TaxID=575233 RepID=A0A4Y7M743_9CRUS|nr:EOG090X02G1 [Daphnia hispanica]